MNDRFAIILLAATVIALGGWFTHELTTNDSEMPDVAATDPGQQPALAARLADPRHIAAHRPASPGQAIGSRVDASQDPTRSVRPVQATWGTGGIQIEDRTGRMTPGFTDPQTAPIAGSPQADRIETPLQFHDVLDRVFAPDRAMPAGEPAAHVSTDGSQATPSRTDTRSNVNQPPATERAFHAAFMELAAQDPPAFERRAMAVLQPGGEDCEKVAMLRALYDVDPGRASGFFMQAITGLADHPRAEGASVPAFAVAHLCRHAGDQVVRTTLERMAWEGYLTVSDSLRQVAADNLVASANEAELRRYAAIPGFRMPARADEPPP